MDRDSTEVPAEERQRSSRNLDELGERLQAWMVSRLGTDAGPTVSDIVNPSANGMSSETLLFNAEWGEGGRRSGSFVARVAPDAGDAPVFPVYDLESQYRVLELVGSNSPVPVPKVRWLELESTHLGAPFFVMDRVDGRVPPDVMPYTMGSWLTEAEPAQRRHLQDETVGLLASLHGIETGGLDLSFLEFDEPGATPLRRHVANQRRFYAWARGDRSFPVLERAFDWVEENWPEAEGEPVISWGDARIGNILYEGFEPAAVLDWEMAALGPRELDLGWMIFLHLFFQDITERMEMAGLPEFMRRADVTETYEKLSGYRPRDMEFYEVYAALRHGIVMTRVHARAVHFGEAEWPDDVDSVIHHREVLEQMLQGNFRT